MIINNINEVHYLDNGNIIIGNFSMKNTQFDFRGKNNILFCDGVEFEDSYLRFGGDDSLVYLEKNRFAVKVETRTGFDSTLYFGRDNYINQKVYLYATERKNIIVGNECLLSFNVYLYTCDPHLIYDFSGNRINQSKDILVGDHVWIGQNSLVLKGSELGSGAIVGGNSVISSGEKKSNCIYAGNPAKKVKTDVYFLEVAANNFNSGRVERFEKDPQNGKEKFVFQKDKETLDFKNICELLTNANSAKQRMELVKIYLSGNHHKNRFYI